MTDEDDDGPGDGPDVPVIPLTPIPRWRRWRRAALLRWRAVLVRLGAEKPTPLDTIMQMITEGYRKGYDQGKCAARGFPEVEIYLWECPWCQGGRRRFDDSPTGCRHCGGQTMTNDVAGFEPHELRRAPLPPTLLARPCASCAFRPGSPEDQMGATMPLPGKASPFFCHQGLPGDNDKGYNSPAYMGEMPLGSYLCRSWWDTAIEGKDRPTRAYRDLEGDRARAAARSAERR